MRFEHDLSVKNLKRKPARTASMVLLAAFLSFSVFAGSIVVMSLQNGLDSYQARLGADVVVVPYEAQTKGGLESILLQGIPGYFYMDKSNLDKIRTMENVQTASPQFFLASTSSGCCSVAVQIIGFDPETDFTIQPWIREHYSGAIGTGDVIVGSGISIPVNRQLSFYNTPCTVVAQLEQTGTGLDNAVYANMDTITAMIENAEQLGFRFFEGTNADRAISTVMIKVEDGYSIEDVTDNINIYLRRVKATQAKGMISDIAQGLSNVSRFIGILVAMIWILATVILMITFAITANERTKEFAVLRVVGASQRMLSRLMRTEAAIICIVGSLAGAGAACLLVFPFGNLIKNTLDLPYLLPGAGRILLMLFISVVLSVFVGWLPSSLSARKISRNETGLILRDNA